MAGIMVGLTTYGRDEKNHYTLPAEFVEAVRRAGGVAVPVCPGEPDAEAVLDRLDALVLTGGGDLDPDHYGGERHETIYSTDEERDRTELSLARAAVRRRFPTLCVCRGMQLLNVALGGTLYEHLPDHFGEDTEHRLPPRLPTEHPIDIVPGTRLEAALGRARTLGRSWHHQGVRRLGAGLSAAAHAPDGVVEALELEGHPWLCAVQWHPELSAHADPAHQRLFDRLVRDAAQWRAERP